MHCKEYMSIFPSLHSRSSVTWCAWGIPGQWFWHFLAECQGSAAVLSSSRMPGCFSQSITRPAFPFLFHQKTFNPLITYQIALGKLLLLGGLQALPYHRRLAVFFIPYIFLILYYELHDIPSFFSYINGNTSLSLKGDLFFPVQLSFLQYFKSWGIVQNAPYHHNNSVK